MTGSFMKRHFLLRYSQYSWLLRNNRISQIHIVPQNRSLHWFYQKVLLKNENSNISNKSKPIIHSILLFSTGNCNYKTHYEVLGIDKNATQKEIKEAYIKLGKEYHPDLHQNLVIDESSGENGSSSEKEELTMKFKAINEAYEILGKKESRKTYDLGLPGAGTKENVAREKNEQYKNYKYYDTVEERAQAFHGYPPVDPDYYKRNPDRWKMAGLCVVIGVFGFIIHFSIAKLSADKQGRYLDENTLYFNQQKQQWQESHQKSDPLVQGSEDYNKLLGKLKEEEQRYLEKHQRWFR